MDLSDLHIFRTVVAEGGITRAAEKLLRVQSNVTTRVRQLEDDLGVDLFIRKGKRLHVSPAGQILLDYADKLLGLADEARDAVHDLAPRGLFRLGSIESAAGVRLPGPLSDYRARHEAVKIMLHTGHNEFLTRELVEGRLDAALVVGPIADQPFEAVPVFEEELVLVAGPGHAPITSPEDVCAEPLLAFEHGCPHRRRLETWFGSDGAVPREIIEMSSYHTMLGCAVAGMGVSLMPKIVLEMFPNRDRLTVHPLPEGQNRAPTLLIWRKGARSPKIDALIDILKAEAG